MSLSDLKNVLKNAQNVVYVCGKGGPDETLINMCRELKSSFKKICIVTVNKPYSSLIKMFKGKKIDSSRFYFIDCISSSNMEQTPSKQCVYVSSPSALTELAISLNNLPEEVDLVILDNFSSLALHNDFLHTIRFMNSIIARFRKNSLKSICLTPNGIKPDVLADLSLFADKVITF